MTDQLFSLPTAMPLFEVATFIEPFTESLIKRPFTDREEAFRKVYGIFYFQWRLRHPNECLKMTDKAR